MTEWNIYKIKNMSDKEILEALVSYESAYQDCKYEALEYKKQYNNLKYRIKKIIE